MKEKLRIYGGARLEGEVMVSGGKNAAVAILPAALLGDSPSVIENVPDINDVHIIIEMLRYLGAQVEFADNVVTIDPRTADKFDPPYDLACQMRASYYFAPVLLGVFKPTQTMLAIGIPALRRLSVSFLFAGFCIVAGSTCQALDRSIYSFFISILRQLVVLVPAAWLLSKTGDVNMVWWSFPIAELMSLAASAFFLRRSFKHMEFVLSCEQKDE